MAIIDSSDMATADGWTKVETNGTIVFNQSIGGKDSLAKITNNGGWDSTALVRTTATAGAAGQVIYFQYYSADNGTAEMMKVANTATPQATSDHAGAYNKTDDKWSVWDKNDTNGSSEAYTPATWYDVKIEINDDGTINVFERAEDGTAYDDIADWVGLGTTSRVTYDFDAVDIYMHFTSTKAGTSGIWYIGNWVYTDDGVVNPSVSGRRASKRLISMGQM